MVEEPNWARASWRKSSRSSGAQGCVEFARLANQVAVRDSKDTAGPQLTFSAKAWRAFVESVKRGDLEADEAHPPSADAHPGTDAPPAPTRPVAPTRTPSVDHGEVDPNRDQIGSTSP